MGDGLALGAKGRNPLFFLPGLRVGASLPAMEAFSRLFAQSQRVMPTNLLSRIWGRFARTSVSRHVIRPFARAFDIAVSEAEMNPQDYPTLNAFFTRRLKPGARPVDDEAPAVVSPVDGRVSAAGICEQDRLLQIKGTYFDLFGLLREGSMARRFEYGTYVTLYLSPQDYHRIHAPMNLSITGLSYMPGTLLPVNPPSVRFNPGLYTQNERITLYADSPAGAIALVLVGANCVGSISLTFHDFRTNRFGRGPMRLNFDSPVNVNKAEELGAFEMGSTVILLFTRDRVQLEFAKEGMPVRMGQRIASISNAA
jgi:phosphatidylserine decarboxylase